MRNCRNLTAFVLAALAALTPAWANETLTLGVFAYRPKAILQERYRPLAEYLAAQCVDTRVELRVLDQDEIEHALARQQLDLLLTNPSHYTQLRNRNHLTGALATLVSIESGQPTDHLGGVMIARSEHPGIARLADLRGRLIAIPGTRFLGGYQTQAYELLHAGVRLPADVRLQQVGSHDAVVAAVLEGRAEFGFIRTGIIEEMSREGKLDPARLQVLNRQWPPDFPYKVSTRLYPEWAFVALPHVDAQKVRKIATSLMALEASHPVARNAGIGGFAPPGDYLPVENLARALRLPPFDEGPTFTIREVWARWQPIWIGLLGGVGFTLLLAVLRLSSRNRALVQLERDLRQANAQSQLAASVFTNAREGIMITDEKGNIVDVNAAFTEITGYTPPEVVGRNASLLSSGRQSEQFYAEFWHSLIRDGHWCGEIWNRRSGGEIFASYLTVSAVRDPGQQTGHYVALFSDITGQKEYQRQLEHMAHFDPMTGLPNRTLLADRLHQAMAQTKRRRLKLAVAMIDLDGFKEINDQHGHSTGDSVLIAIAARMRDTIRESDTIARIGGDEFVAVWADLQAGADALPQIQRLRDAIGKPSQVEDRLLQVTSSIGYTFYPQSEEVEADQLLRQADQAMYQAKLSGKNCCHLFDAEMDRHVRNHNESLEEIRRALNSGEFRLHYQPKVNMRSGTVVGVEALVRWQHPTRGLLPPSDFLPTLEKHQLDIDLGLWVLDAALAQVEAWQAQGLALTISVNISALHLQQPDFVEHLRRALAAHPGLHPKSLEIEVVETSALQDIPNVSQVISACERLGVGFALDDFGTGYSSLTYLKHLPVGVLKIDRSFVRDMLHDPEDLAILEGIRGLAHAFRREVVAEGVETVEHGVMLLRLGCELAQGNGIARPMPAESVPRWVDEWRPPICWSQARRLRHSDLPLLYALIEHGAWIKAFEAHASGQRATPPPPLDLPELRFGQRLDGALDDGAGPDAEERLAIESLHRRMQELAQALLQRRSEGDRPGQDARLAEMHALNQRLQESLQHWQAGTA